MSFSHLIRLLTLINWVNHDELGIQNEKSRVNPINFLLFQYIFTLLRLNKSDNLDF